LDVFTEMKILDKKVGNRIPREEIDKASGQGPTMLQSFF